MPVSYSLSIAANSFSALERSVTRHHHIGILRVRCIRSRFVCSTLPLRSFAEHKVMKLLWFSFLTIALAVTNSSSRDATLSATSLSSASSPAFSTGSRSVHTSVTTSSSSVVSGLVVISAPSTVSSVVSIPPTTVTNSPKTQPVIKPPITPTTFTPFPVPSEQAVRGVFEVTDPSQPPPVRMLKL